MALQMPLTRRAPAQPVRVIRGQAKVSWSMTKGCLAPTRSQRKPGA
ncbi:MAG TPA: hypothetical protein VJ783_13945 [Pirellulales bacterium]|nr:hypothetical protein [Pirellulales bacterium]